MTLKKLKKFLDSLYEEDLIELYKLLSTNNDFLVNEIKEQIIKINRKEHKVCSVCGNALSDEYLELIFGKLSFRRRAYFCGRDCLQYFLDSMDRDSKRDLITVKSKSDFESEEDSNGESIKNLIEEKNQITKQTNESLTLIKAPIIKNKKRKPLKLSERIFNLFF